MPVSPSRRGLLRAAAALASAAPFAGGCGPKARTSLPPAGLPDPERLLMLEAAREAYAYDYDKPNLRGVATLARLPPNELPSPEWVEKVVDVVTQIGLNESATRGAPTPSPEQLVARMTAPGANPASVAIDAVVSMASGASREGEARKLSSFDAQFGEIPRPPVAARFREDAEFARLRLAGPNPTALRRVSPGEGLPEDLGVTEALARAGLAAGDSLEAALAEGRLFLCACRELLDVEVGADPVPPEIALDHAADPRAWDAAYAAREAAYGDGGARPKLRVAPLALFAVPPGGGALAPVAIQLLPNGVDGLTYPVFTPADGVAWQRAKTMFNAADATLHEVGTHLARTHLVQEAFALAMHNCLPVVHPLHALLAPHFEGTFLINSAAERSLVDSASPVDRLLMPTIGGSIRLSAASLRSFDMAEAALPRQLALRGVDDPTLITDYPYRDDGLLIWDALSAWVGELIGLTYDSDARVAGDGELQDFVAQVGAYKAEAGGRRVGGGVSGVGPVRTRAALQELVTGILFNGSAQHAAVNFPQRDALCYTPNMPLAAFGPLPAHGDPPEAWLEQLPSLDLGRLQLMVTWLLGSVHHTRLGGYSPGAFEDPEVLAALSRHRGRLDDIEATITERNRSRVPYPFLLPSRVPLSINI